MHKRIEKTKDKATDLDCLRTFRSKRAAEAPASPSPAHDSPPFPLSLARVVWRVGSPVPDTPR